MLTQMGDDFAKAVWHQDTIFEAGGEGWKRARTGFLCLQADDAQSEDGRTGEGGIDEIELQMVGGAARQMPARPSTVPSGYVSVPRLLM